MCPGGCVGGVLNVENPFIARNRMRQLAEKMRIPPATLEGYGLDENFFIWDKIPEPSTSFQLDPNRFVAMQKLMLVEEYLKKRLASTAAPAARRPAAAMPRTSSCMHGGVLDCVKLDEVGNDRFRICREAGWCCVQRGGGAGDRQRLLRRFPLQHHLPRDGRLRVADRHEQRQRRRRCDAHRLRLHYFVRGRRARRGVSPRAQNSSGCGCSAPRENVFEAAKKVAALCGV